MTDTALFDVACPMCDAGPLEHCTNPTTGLPMWETVHFPRRYASGVQLAPTPRERPTNRTHCNKGLHPWTPENTFTTTDGKPRCRACRNDRQRTRTPNPRQHTGPRRAVTHCIHGHEYTEENTYRAPNGGSRRCITCKKEHRAKAYATTGE